MQLRSTFFAAMLAWAPFALAQGQCSDYWKFAPRSSNPGFSVNGQSKGASVQVGVPSELNIIIYKGQDYRISFAYDEKIIGDHLVARILEKVRQPRHTEGADGKPDAAQTTFEDVKKVIWDNQDHEMADAVEFTAASTKRIAIEVTAPGVPDDPKAKKRGSGADIGCVGILIEHMPTPNLGF